MPCPRPSRGPAWKIPAIGKPGTYVARRGLVIVGAHLARACLASLMLGGAVQAETCRLALVLALDISSSVDAAEDALQRQGLAAALLAPEVQTAILSGDPIAVSVFEWSGRYNQRIIASWRMLRHPQDIAGLSRTIAASRRSYSEFPTAMGYALHFGADLFDTAPNCLFRTLDMAGDGQNNEGAGPSVVYQDPAYAEITVNGLVVNAADYEAEVDLIKWYQREVLHGPGAFLEIAQGFDDYETAMRRKLERETRPRVTGAIAPDSPPWPTGRVSLSRYSGSVPSSTAPPGAARP